jgi:hypothetical protein
MMSVAVRTHVRSGGWRTGAIEATGVVAVTGWDEQGSSATVPADGAADDQWDRVPLFEALRSRRSRRFGLGMRMDAPLSFESQHDPVPLTEEEQAVLAFAASGITGYALNDLTLGAGQGGSMMSGLVGRTVSMPTPCRPLRCSSPTTPGHGFCAAPRISTPRNWHG